MPSAKMLIIAARRALTSTARFRERRQPEQSCGEADEAKARPFALAVLDGDSVSIYEFIEQPLEIAACRECVTKTS